MGNTPFLARIPEEKGQVGTPICTWKDNI